MTAPNVAPGSVIAGRFSVRSLLGYGGATATFRAVTAQARDVALKLYSPLIGQRPEAMQHLQRCVAETNALPPDLAAHILEAGYDPATAAPFTLTDFVQSPSLAQVVLRRPMGAEEVAAMLRTLAAVLDAAHARELFHHGLKPTNVFVDPAAPGNVKVTDFGPALARAMLPTPEGYVLAAPWIAPEQVQAGVQPRAAADIFSAALLAFAALTGRSYWRSCQGPVDVPSWQRELMGPRAPASARAAEIGIPLSPALDGIFARALAHDPNDRFRSATELAAALSGFATTRMDVGTTLALAPSINEAAALPPQGLTGTIAVAGAVALPPLPSERAQLPVETQIAPAPAYFSQGAPAGPPAPSAPAAPSPAISAAAPATPAPGGASPAEALSATPPPGAPSPAASVPSASAAAAPPSLAHVSPAAPTVASGGTIPSRSPLGKAASIAVGIAAVLLVGGAAAAWFALSGEEETPSPTAPGDVGSASASAPVAPAPPEVPTSAPAASAPTPSPDAGTPDDAGASEDAASASTDAPVKITCKPVDCEEIAIDGKPVDLGAELRLSPGPHRISVKRAGYTPQIRTIIVKAGTPVEQAFELAAVPPSKPAPATNKPCGKFLKRCK